MRLIVIFLLFFATVGYGQNTTVRTNKSVVKDTFTLRNVSVSRIDTTIAGTGSIYALATTRAVAKVVTLPDSVNVARRSLTNGDTIRASSFPDFISWLTRAIPTMSMTVSPSNTVIERGSTVVFTFNTTILNPSAYTLTNASNGIENGTQLGFAGLTNSRTITFNPTGGGAEYTGTFYRIRSRVNYAKGAESGLLQSNSVDLVGVYPVFYGVSNTDFFTTGNISTSLTKMVETEGNKSVTFNGSGFLYVAIPTAWTDNDLSSIRDPNGFETINSFTNQIISVNSSIFGIHNYRIYKLNNLTSATNAIYSISR